MKVKEAKVIINIIKNEPISIVLIFSLLILPLIFLEWIHFFPPTWKLIVIGIILIIWVISLIRLRKELLIYRRKIILQNYLQKDKRHSFNHLVNEWAGKNEFTKKNIRELIKIYPDIFKYTKVKSGDEKKDGVGLVEYT